MNYRLFGRTGVLVSPLCLGTMNFGSPTSAEDSAAIIHRALDGGINMIDTADVYNGGESERIVGKTLKDSGRRQQVFLATKVYNRTGDGPNDTGASRYHIIKGCEDSLRRLQTDYIDLSTNCIVHHRRTCRRTRPCAPSRIWSEPAKCSISGHPPSPPGC